MSLAAIFIFVLLLKVFYSNSEEVEFIINEKAIFISTLGIVLVLIADLVLVGCKQFRFLDKLDEIKTFSDLHRAFIRYRFLFEYKKEEIPEKFHTRAKSIVTFFLTDLKIEDLVKGATFFAEDTFEKILFEIKGRIAIYDLNECSKLKRELKGTVLQNTFSAEIKERLECFETTELFYGLSVCFFIPEEITEIIKARFLEDHSLLIIEGGYVEGILEFQDSSFTKRIFVSAIEEVIGNFDYGELEEGYVQVKKYPRLAHMIEKEYGKRSLEKE